MTALARALPLLACLLACRVSSQGASPDRDALITELFERARAHDVTAVEALAHHFDKDDFAYPLALYIAAPDERVQTFVAAIPRDSSIMGRVYGLEVAVGADGKRLTPRFLFTFDELASAAGRGVPGAMERLLLAAGNSDGAVAEFLCERLPDAVVARSGEALAEFDGMDRDHRNAVLACLSEASAEEKVEIRRTLPAASTAALAQAEEEMLAAIE